MSGIYIERIDIETFGRLKGVSVTPSEGLNLLTAPNESGKTTLASFIKFIFYGFGGQRKQSIAENEKLLYMPWSGARAAGGITLVTPNGKFRVERSVSASKETLDVYDTATRKSVFTGMVPGEVFFGVGEESFQKIIFLKQLYTTKNGDDALAEQVQNLIFSADEKTNTERAVKKLREARASLKNNQRRGLIPNLEAELSGYEASLTESLEIKRRLDEICVSLADKKKRLAFNADKLEALRAEAENIRRFEAHTKLEGILASAKLKKEAEARYSECMSRFDSDSVPDTDFVRGLIDDHASYALLGKRLSETDTEIKAGEAEAAKLKSSSPFFENDIDEVKKALSLSRTLLYILGAAAVLLLAGAAATWFSGSGTAAVILAVLGGVSAVAAAATALVKPAKVRRLGVSGADLKAALEGFPILKMKYDEALRKISSLEKSYSDDSAAYAAQKRSIETRIRKYIGSADEPYDISIDRLLNLSVEAGKLKAEFMSASSRLEADTAGVDIRELQANAEGAVTPKRDMNAVTRESEFYRQQNEALGRQETELEKQKSTLEARSPAPAVLYGKREAVSAKLDECRMKFDALGMALDVLEESGNYMKATVSPKLAQLAAGYFRDVSDYSDISLTTDLSMSVATPNGEKSSDFLSAGARDTAYLSLRYALIDLLYERSRPFIILDDAFSRIDDTRIKPMLARLAALAAEQQVFIFTCHGREAKALGEAGADFRVLML